MTGEVVGQYPQHTADDVEEALNRAREAFLQWRELRFAERADLLRRAADYLREQKSRFATLISTEMGKPIAEAEAEIEKCAWGCDFYAQHAESMLADRAEGVERPGELRRLRPARHRARRHALELPLLAGLPLRRARADGRQHRAA